MTAPGRVDGRRDVVRRPPIESLPYARLAEIVIRGLRRAYEAQASAETKVLSAEERAS